MPANIRVYPPRSLAFVMPTNRSSTLFSVCLVFCIYAWMIVPVESVKDLERVCAINQSRLVNESSLVLCYVNHVQDRYINVSFTVGELFNVTFSEFRFVIFSTESELLHNECVEHTTDFLNISDASENLLIKELEDGQYKACVDFRTAQSDLIYEPRDACVLMQIGKISHRSFDKSAPPIMVILVVAIVIFFILGVTVPPVIKRRDERRVLEEKQSIGSSSTVNLTRRQRLAKRLFHQHIEQGPLSHAHQWARARVGRHMVAPDEVDIMLQKFAPVLRQGIPDIIGRMIPTRDILRHNFSSDNPPIRPSASNDIELTPRTTNRTGRFTQQSSHTTYDMANSESF